MATVDLRIELEIGSSPPRGSIVLADCEERFEGWMALNQAIERARLGELGGAPAAAVEAPAAEEE